MNRTDSQPFYFRGARYATISEVEAAGAVVPAPISAAERAANWAILIRKLADQKARADARKAADAAEKAARRAELAEAGVDADPGQGGPGDPVAKARHAEAVAYVASYVGRWGLPLDIRSDPRWGTKYLRLTDRQVDALIAGKAREAQWAAERTPAPVATPVAAALPVTEDGMYQTADGTIWKVQKAIHGSGRLYAKKLVVYANGTSAAFEYAPGGITRLTPADKMTLEAAMAFGQLYGICCNCAAPLTDEESIKLGIGPVCRKRF